MYTVFYRLREVNNNVLHIACCGGNLYPKGGAIQPVDLEKLEVFHDSVSLVAVRELLYKDYQGGNNA